MTATPPVPAAGTTVALLGTVTLDPDGDADAGWSRIRDLVQAGGLAPLPAARLALAVVTLVDEPRDPTVVQVVRTTDRHGTRIEAVIRGSPAAGTSCLPPGLVDVSYRRTATGAVDHVLGVAADPAPAADRPSWTALSDAAAHASTTRQLLAAALVAASRVAANPGTVDTETEALRLELDETNRGMLALHAELSRHEEQLDQARAVAERAHHAKAAFLSTMSHEIRSPLNAVLGFTGLLLTTDLTAEQLEFARAVETAGRHLVGVIDDVLDLSKIESGRLELEEIPFDLYACVEDAAAMLALQAAEKDLPLAVLFAPGTPVLAGGDPMRIRQILVNLLANAVKFTSHGQITVDVSHRPATATSHELTFRVADTGIGIRPEHLDRLFTPFTQADPSVTRFHGGTGLGLSICRQLAELMGGSIAIESTVGEGSVFTCTIRVGTVTGEPAADDPPLSRTRILVVHRHAVIGEAIRQHLRSWGADVVTGASLGEVIRQTGGRPGAALAFLDADRQADFTRDAALLAAATDHQLPIIAVTAPAGRTPAAAESVSTPIRRAHLRAAVLAALGRTPAG